MKKHNFLKSITTILYSSLTLLLVNRINIFATWSLIPEEYHFEAALFLYAPCITIIGDALICALACIKNKLVYTIECMFHLDKDCQELNNNPVITLDTDQPKDIRCHIEISGKRSNFCNKELKISFPDWVDIQRNKLSDNALRVDLDRNCWIDLDSVLTASDSVEISKDFILKLIRVPSETENKIKITAIIQDKCKPSYLIIRCLDKIRCTYKYNTLTLKCSGYGGNIDGNNKMAGHNKQFIG